MTTNETIDKMSIMRMAKKLAKEAVETVGYVDIILVIAFVACVITKMLQL